MTCADTVGLRYRRPKRRPRASASAGHDGRCQVRVPAASVPG